MRRWSLEGTAAVEILIRGDRGYFSSGLHKEYASNQRWQQIDKMMQEGSRKRLRKEIVRFSAYLVKMFRRIHSPWRIKPISMNQLTFYWPFYSFSSNFMVCLGPEEDVKWITIFLRSECFAVFPPSKSQKQKEKENARPCLAYVVLRWWQSIELVC